MYSRGFFLLIKIYLKNHDLNLFSLEKIFMNENKN